jgi:hypothetical protein
MKLLVIACCALLTVACGASKKISNKGAGDTRTKEVIMATPGAFLLTEQSNDKTYAFTPENPVKVGGVKENVGALNERYYLNALLGPLGEQISYNRVGSCCGFKTPNAFIGDTGLLDKYEVTWEGLAEPIYIYINMYDYGDLMIPVGMRAIIKL